MSGRVLRAEGVIAAVSEQGACVEYEAIGALFECTIDERRLAWARERLRFDELSAMLAKPLDGGTHYEGLVITALHWFGEASQDDSPPNKVVRLCTALEALLIGAQVDRLTSELAERVAIVMEEKLDARKQLKRRMKKLYGLRSRVVHDGKRDVPEREARELECIVLQTIVAMAGRLQQIQRKADVEVWFEDIRLSSGSDPS